MTLEWIHPLCVEKDEAIPLFAITITLFLLFWHALGTVLHHAAPFCFPIFTSLHVKSNMYTYTEHCVCDLRLISEVLMCCAVICTLSVKIVGIIRQLSVSAVMTMNLDAFVKTVVQQHIYDIFLLLHSDYFFMMMMMIMMIRYD